MAETPSAALGRIAGEFTDRRARGERPTVEEYAARHPELAGLLREVLPLLVAVTPDPGTHTAPAGQDGDVAPPGDVPGYEVLGVLGQGGMGVVYKARQTALGRAVALKMVLAGHVSHGAMARFLAEAELAARLRHPNIVQVYDLGQ